MFINWPFILVVWTAFVVVAFCFLTNCLIKLQFSDASHTFRQWFKLSKWGLMSCDWLILVCICIEKTFFFKWCQCLSNIPVIYIYILNISIYMLLQYIVCCLCLMSFQRRKSVVLPGALTLLHHDSNLSHCIWFLTNVLNSRLENKQMCI